MCEYRPVDTDQAIATAQRHFAAGQAELAVPSIAWGLMRAGVVVHTEGLGETVLGSGEPPTADTVFRIASMTKSFTASAILLLRDRGALRLDDLLTDHCPWTATIGSAAPISIRDLLSMQAGLPTDDPWGDRQEDLAIDAFDELVAGGLSFAREPRRAFEYSNLGYALLGRVITSASGVDNREFVRTELLEPLGMSSTGFDANAVAVDRRAQGYAPVDAGLVAEPFTGSGAFSSMGGLLSTVNDLAVWVEGLAGAAAGRDGVHPLSASSRLEMQAPQMLVGTTVPTDSDGNKTAVTRSYCYGLATDDDQNLGRFVSHSGGYPGFGSHMRWHPGTDWAIVALGNRTYANMTRLASQALAEIVKNTDRDKAPTLWPATEQAMLDTEALLAAWDDDLADRVLAMNIDLDRPREERARAWRELGSKVSPFTRTSQLVESDSPAYAKWWVEGAGGRVKLEVLMSPEKSARIQYLQATPDDEPS